MKKRLTKIYVGVDISKKWLDIHCNPTGKTMHISNDVEGIANLLQELSGYDVMQVVFESSGGYEFFLHQMLDKAGYNTWQVDPSRVKAFRISEGIKVKTDAYDAKILSLFAANKKRTYKPKKASEKMNKLYALIKRRADLTTIAANEKKRLNHPQQQYCREIIKKHIAFIKKQIEAVDKEINEIIDKDNELKRRKEAITSIPGVGDTTAASLIASIPELGTVKNNQISALLGVAPYQHQSGRYVGIAHIRGGRFAPRQMIYMAALTASRCNEIFAAFYKRLLAVGKKPKVALVAVMRKIIITLNAMIRRNELWKIV